MPDDFLEIQVLNADDDLLDLLVEINYRTWRTQSRVYASACTAEMEGRSIWGWLESPCRPIRLQAAATLPVESLTLEFYTIDSARHACCAIQLLNNPTHEKTRPAQTWQFSIEASTDMASIEQFSKEYFELGVKKSGSARLVLLPI